MTGLFVTGTDTGVGKTMVSTALVRAFSRRGLRVAPMKPCETGDGDDAARLIAASGRALALEEVSPFRFPMPASPEAAAAAAGARIDPARIRAAFARLTRDADLAIVEGAGGLLVPIAPGFSTADLARALELPILIVARASLGTVNHTLLTVEAARRRDLRVLGVVLSRANESAGPDEPTNPDAIARHGQVEILGTLPRLASTDPDLLADAAEQHLNLGYLANRLNISG
jgi:dethiobiotin synthetase